MGIAKFFLAHWPLSNWFTSLDRLPGGVYFKIAWACCFTDVGSFRIVFGPMAGSGVPGAATVRRNPEHIFQYILSFSLRHRNCCRVSRRYLLVHVLSPSVHDDCVLLE